MLEFAKVLSWQHRITRAVVRQRDLFGRWSSRWTVRTSNAYVFRDPQPQLAGVPIAKFENRRGTSDQDILDLIYAPARDPDSLLERALARFGEAVAAKEAALNKDADRSAAARAADDAGCCAPWRDGEAAAMTKSHRSQQQRQRRSREPMRAQR
jgi:hypothetical protein